MDKLVPLSDPNWANNEARQAFEHIQKMRDDVAASFAIDPALLGTREKLSYEMTAREELEMRERRRWTPERIAEVEGAYRDALAPFNKRLVELLSLYTTRYLIEKTKDEPQD